MTFKPALAQKILSGEKTQTRRLITSAKCRYEPGKDYAVQPGRGKPAIGRMLVTAVRRERLIDISEEDARAEGFVDRAAFFDAWGSMHGEPTIQEVWVITVERLNPQESPTPSR